MNHLTGTLSIFLLFLFLSIGCDTNDALDDDDEVGFTGNSTTYELLEGSDSGISGFAVFEEMTNGDTFISIQLDGTEGGESYEAHIHENSVAQGGPIEIPLENVDGTSGESETLVEAGESGFSYGDLIQYDGHINVHDPDDLAVIVSEGNIGSNANGDDTNGNGGDDNDGGNGGNGDDY